MSYYAVEKPNGYIITYFDTFNEAINYVDSVDRLGIFDLNIRLVN